MPGERNTHLHVTGTECENDYEGKILVCNYYSILCDENTIPDLTTTNSSHISAVVYSNCAIKEDVQEVKRLFM